MGSTTGMSNGDLIRIAGVMAASADLYSYIVTVDSGTQVTIGHTATYAGTGKAVRAPKFLTCEDSFTRTSDTTWGCGGTRLSLNGSTRLADDLKAGWTMEVQYSEAGDYTTTAVWNFTGAGDTTSGRITIKGTGAKKPKIKAASTATNIFDIQNALYTVKGLSFDKCLDVIRYSTANAADVVVENCEFTEVDGFTGNAVHVVSTATGGRLEVKDCSFYYYSLYTGGMVDIDASIAAVVVDNCRFLASNPAAGMPGVDNSVAPGVLIVQYCSFSTTTSAIVLGSSATAGLTIIDHCTMWNIPYAITCGHVARCRGMIIRNNIFVSVSGTALDLPSGSVNAVAQVNYNVFCDCVIPRSATTPVGPSDSVGALGSEIDPLFIDPANGDFRVSPNMHYNVSTYPTFGEPGAYGRREPIAGFDIFGRLVYAEDAGDSWNVMYKLTGGTGLPAALLGTGEVINILKSAAPAAGTPHVESLRQNLLQFLRNNTLLGVVDREIVI